MLIQFSQVIHDVNQFLIRFVYRIFFVINKYIRKWLKMQRSARDEESRYSNFNYIQNLGKSFIASLKQSTHSTVTS